MSDEDDTLQLLQIELVGMMMDLAEDNKRLPKNKQLPQSLFSIYMLSITQWFEWQNHRPAAIATFDNWAEWWGYNDLHFIRDTFKLTEEQESILDKFEAWCLSLKMNELV